MRRAAAPEWRLCRTEGGPLAPARGTQRAARHTQRAARSTHQNQAGVSRTWLRRLTAERCRNTAGSAAATPGWQAGRGMRSCSLDHGLPNDMQRLSGVTSDPAHNPPWPSSWVTFFSPSLTLPRCTISSGRCLVELTTSITRLSNTASLADCRHGRPPAQCVGGCVGGERGPPQHLRATPATRGHSTSRPRHKHDRSPLWGGALPARRRQLEGTPPVPGHGRWPASPGCL